MKKYLKKNRGFTLMEILIVIGMVAIIGSTASIIEINNFRGDSFRSEVNNIGTALQTARADAFNNINQAKHGVAFKPGGYPGYVIFEGNSYATADVAKNINVLFDYGVNFSLTSPTEIVFDQLSGNANHDGDITIIDPQRNMSTVININHEGKISW